VFLTMAMMLLAAARPAADDNASMVAFLIRESEAVSGLKPVQ
jgi:hypothetical protein